MSVVGTLRSRISRRRRSGKAAVADKRYTESQLAVPLVELMNDEDLEQLNAMLDWHCFTVDRRGRPLGRPAWQGKRDTPQEIPDRRVELFHERFDLSDKHVLEVGCFEGIHTIALCDRAAKVTAIDGRVENVVKTIVRCSLFERYPTVLVCDLENPEPAEDRLSADVCHHVGVLYHLTDPVSHLRDVGRWVSRGLMLDTHIATPEAADSAYEVDGRPFRYRQFGETRRDPFSGMRDHSKWILLDDMIDTLNEAGFTKVDVVERREERNGPRVLLLAEKT